MFIVSMLATEQLDSVFYVDLSFRVLETSKV